MTETHYTFGIMFAMGCVIGAITLIYVIRLAFSRTGGEIGGWELRGAPRRIFAVARTTIAEGMRAKVASGFALMILIAIPLFWLTADGDGTIKGKIQMFLAYAMGFTGFILALLTIFFSVRSLSVEITSRQIYSIVTKPIPRWQILAGKWLGIMALNVAIMLLATLATYAGTHATVYQFKKSLAHELETYGSLKPSQATAVVESLDHVKGVGKLGEDSPVVTAFTEKLGWPRQQTVDMLLQLPEATRVNLRRFDEVRRQVLVARASIAPPKPDYTEEINRIYKQLREDNQIPQGWTRDQVMVELERELAVRDHTIPYGLARYWRLQGPPPEKGDEYIMSLRFNPRVQAELPPITAFGRSLEADRLWCEWGFGDTGTAQYQEQRGTYAIDTINEIEMPVESVESNGTIHLLFANRDPRQVDVIFGSTSKDLEVLYRVGSFEMGLAQAALALLVPLACLACFGVWASTFLSLPVGALVLFTLYLVSSSTGFIAESLAVTYEYVDPSVDPGFWWHARKAVVDSIDVVLAIGDLDPVPALIEGKIVDWSVPWHRGIATVAKSWPFALAKGGIFMLIGVWVFRRREVAAVIV